MAPRACFECGEGIQACNGFVVAGDFILAVQGLLPFGKVRERCAKCVERILAGPPPKAVL